MGNVAITAILGMLGLSNIAPEVEMVVAVAPEILPAIDAIKKILATKEGQALKGHLTNVLSQVTHTGTHTVTIGKGTPVGEWVWVGGLVGYEWRTK